MKNGFQDNNMTVRLISSSHDNLIEEIAMMARVSNPSNQNNSKTSEKLVKYLIKHKHWSPFEMVSLTLEIDTTRDIAHQIVRHRSFAFQEFSQRYADPAAMGFPYELRETRMQDEKNRQNSIETDDELINSIGFSNRSVLWMLQMEYISGQLE